MKTYWGGEEEIHSFLTLALDEGPMTLAHKKENSGFYFKLLAVIENSVLRRIFEPETEEAAEGWKTLHNEELHNLYASTNVIRVIKLRRMSAVGGACSMHGN